MLPRIVFLSSGQGAHASAQSAAQTLAQGLGERGHAVHAVSALPPVDPMPEFDEPYFTSLLMYDRRPGPRPRTSFVRRFDPRRRRANARFAQARAAAVGRLTDLLRSGPPGILVVTDLAAVDYLRESRSSGWRIVGLYDGSGDAAAAGRDLGRFTAAFSDADWAVLPTRADAEVFLRAGMQNTTVMPLPLREWPSEPVGADGRTVVALGPLTRDRRMEPIVTAWARVAAERPGWSLRLVGTGPDEERLRRLTSGLPVSFVTDAADPARTVDGVTLVVTAAVVEGWALPLAQVMAFGIPVVATDSTPGLRARVVDGGTGRLVPPFDPAALSAALLDLTGDPDDRSAMGARARESVRPLGPEPVAAAWEEFLALVAR